MNEINRGFPVLMADDDLDDCLLAKEAWELNGLRNPLIFVHNGEELLDYLRKQSKFAAPVEAPRPGLIFLDLNMPRLDGREALKEIKKDPELRSIPVIILTTSQAEEDIYRTYDLGVNSFVTKPVTFLGLSKALKAMREYWFEIVHLPGRPEEE